MKTRQRLFAFVATLAVGAAAVGQSIDPILERSSMFGVSHSSGKLWRYDFGTDSLTEVSHVRNIETGAVMTGLQAAGYFKGFQQLHAFWTDPADDHAKVVHIDAETGEARLTGIDMGEGRVRGAVALQGSDGGTATWRVFALQTNVEPEHAPAIAGMANINPSNSASNEFTMQTSGGAITHDSLKTAAVDEHGVLYQGAATSIYIRPKGNGNQNGLILNGEPFLLNNGNTYEFSGAMTVKLFNDHIKNAKAMGHWWIGIDAQTATVKENGTTIVSPPEPWVPTSKLVSLHTETGLATTVMELSRHYKGLASLDGNTFYAATSGSDNIYRINVSAKSETFVGSPGSAYDFTDLEFIGSTLMAFDEAADKLVPLSSVTGLPVGSGASLGVTNLGTMIFMPTNEIPARVRLAFD